MKLRSVQINNYKSLKDVKIDTIGNLNVFIGKNNSGKSNIFQALNLLSKNMSTYPNVAIGSFSSIGLDDLETRLKDVIQIKKKSNSESLKKEQFFKNDSKKHPIEIIIKMELSNEEYESIMSYLVENTFEKSEKFKKITIESTFLKEITYVVKSYNMALMVEEISTNWNSEKVVIHKLSHSNNNAQKLNIVEFCARMGIDNFNPTTIKENVKQSIYGKAYNVTKISNYPFDEHIFFMLYYHFFLHLHNLSANVKLPFERDSFTKTELLADDGSDIQKVLSTLHSNDHERFKYLETQIRKIIPDIKIIKAPFVETNYTQTKFTESQPDIEFNIQDVGSGLQRAIMIICKVLTAEKGDMVLIEEPESNLHADAKRKLFEFLNEQSEEKQIFITTHDPLFSSLTNLDNVRLVKKTSDGTSIIGTIDEYNVYEIINELGVKPSDFFDDDKIIFVEGPTDQSIFSTLRKKLDGAIKINFIDTEGFNNMDYFANAKIIRSNKFKIPVFVIFDGDTETDAKKKEKKQKVIDKLGLSPDKILTLSKNTIENYLLIPRAISAFSMIPIEQVSSFFEENTSRNKKEVLANLFKQHGLRYSEETAKKIAEKMTSDEFKELKEEVFDKLS